MGFEVKDGTGTGNLARVDKENKLAVRAVQETEFEKAVLTVELLILILNF